MRSRLLPSLASSFAILALMSTGAIAAPQDNESLPVTRNDAPALTFPKVSSDGDVADSVAAAPLSDLTMVGEDRQDVPGVATVEVEIGKNTSQANAPEDEAAELPSDLSDDTTNSVLESMPSRVIDTRDADLVGVTWEAGLEPDRIEIRTHNADGWGAWTPAPAVDSEEGGDSVGTDPFWIGEATELEIRAVKDGADIAPQLDAVMVNSSSVEADADVAAEVQATEGSYVGSEGGPASDPGPAVSVAGTGASSGATRRALSAQSATAPTTPSSMVPGINAPVVISRAGWGADESWRGGNPSYSHQTRAVVLHHTAGSNSYTRDQSASIVRGIYSYHTRTLGWNDIGYNVLIDKYGQIFEGRAGGLHRNVTGAHASGSNTNTFGVSIMGDYSKVTPSSAAQTAVVDISAWKLGSSYAFDVNSLTTIDSKAQPRFIGHRDARQGATACPGAAAYALMPDLRNRIQSQLSRYETSSYRLWQSLGGESVLGTVTHGEHVSTSGERYTQYSNDYKIFHTTVGPVLGGTQSSMNVSRVGGSDRYAVSANASSLGFPQGSSHVVIASGELYSDALASAPFAARNSAPLLLVRQRSVPASVAAELTRLKPQNITIAGGAATVSTGVERELRALTGATVRRVAGADRYEVAANFATHDTPIFVASGEVFSDALSAGSGAALSGGSVLLSRKGTLPAATAHVIRRNANQPVYIVGGTATINEEVEAQIRNLGANPVRLDGDDRYEVSTRVAQTVKPGGASTVHIASGLVFPDALSAVPLAAVSSSPVLLSRPQTLSIQAHQYMNQAPTRSMVLMGGESTLNSTVAMR